MRLLFALPYGPGPTRIRSRMLLEELTKRHEVTLLSLCWNNDDVLAAQYWAERGVETTTVHHPVGARIRAAAGHPQRPLQQIVSTSPEFARQARSMIRAAQRDARPYDAVHIEHLRGAAAIDLLRLTGIRTVLDAVDCLAELAKLSRRHSPSRVVRVIARYEEQRTRQLENSLLKAASAVTVVAERDRLALLNGSAGDHVEVVPNGVIARSHPVDLTDEPLAIFTGKLSYHANQAAVRWLLDDIWPRVRAGQPCASLIIAGANPPPWIVRYSGAAGVRVIANPAEMQPLIESARVSVAPIIYSVGIQNKVLEAMATGIPVVASPAAIDGLLPEAAGSLVTARSGEDAADALIRLLHDRDQATALGRRGYDYVATHHSWPNVGRKFEALYAGRPTPAEVGK